jgi:hypothetical protein
MMSLEKGMKDIMVKIEKSNNGREEERKKVRRDDNKKYKGKQRKRHQKQGFDYNFKG